MRYSILQCLLIIRFFLIQYIVHKNTVHIISLFDQSDGPTIYLSKTHLINISIWANKCSCLLKSFDLDLVQKNISFIPSSAAFRRSSSAFIFSFSALLSLGFGGYNRWIWNKSLIFLLWKLELEILRKFGFKMFVYNLYFLGMQHGLM